MTVAHPVHVFLRPGELYFGGPGDYVETILGSCVSITVWHPRYRVGGMCHYLVPDTGWIEDPIEDPSAGHSAPDAVQALLDHIDAASTRPEDYVVKIFGGGAQFSRDGRDHFDIGHRNVDAGLALLAQHGLTPKVMHVRGVGHRRIVLELDTGHVWLRHGRIRLHTAIHSHR